MAGVASKNVAATEAMVEMFNRGEIDDLLARFAADEIVFDYSRSLGPDQKGLYRGVEEVGRFLRDLLEPWEEFELFVDESTEVGDDIVVVDSHTRSLGRGSGIEVDARGAMLFEFRGDRLAAWRLFQDKEEALASAEEGE